MAQRFRFRLEVVETLRRRARDARRRVVAEKLRAVADIEQRIVRFTAELAEGADRCRATQQTQGSFDIHGMSQYMQRRSWLEQSIADATGEKEQAQLALSKVQRSLAEASQHLRVIEKLHERQLRRHRAESARREQAQSDEATIQRFLRRQRISGSEMFV